MIRGNRRPLREPEAAERVTAVTARLETGIHNRFDVEVTDARTGQLRQKAQALNVVCDALFDRLLTPAAYFSYILYGSGTGTPSASDTALFNRVGSASAGDVLAYQQNEVEGWYSVRKKIVLNESAAVGVTLTEVGIGYDSTHCVTHALLRDMNGNPITITKTDTDIITIYATVYCHWDPAGYERGKIALVSPPNQAQSVALFNFLCGVATLGSQSVFGCLGVQNPDSYQTKGVTLGYSKANRSISLTFSRWAVGEMNNYFSKFLVIGNGAKFPKDGNVMLTLAVGGSWFTPAKIIAEPIGTGDGIKTDFATAFPVDSQYTVYVDGVAETGVTVDEHYPVAKNLYSQLRENMVGLSAASTVSRHVYKPLPSLLFVSGNTYKSNYKAGSELIYYNPFFSSVGVDRFVVTRNVGATAYSFYSDLYASDDLTTWTKLLEMRSAGTFTVPAGEKNHRYYKLVITTTENVSTPTLYGTTTFSLQNIHFTTPPAAGTVITADYIPDVIAKDSSHVFDLTAEITVGPYTGV